MSSNLANSSSLLYQPFLFFTLFLLFFLILLATFFCIVFHIRKEMKSRNRRNRNSDDANLEEAKPLAEGVEPASTKQRKRPFGWSELGEKILGNSINLIQVEKAPRQTG
jgi:hypothetical protein